MMDWGTIFIITVVAAFFILPRLRQAPVQEVVQLLQSGAAFIDVRTPGEYRQVSIPGSVNIPLQELAQRIGGEGISKEDPVLVFCQSGMRSATAMSRLRSLGYTRVRNVGSFGRAQKVWMLSQAKGGERNG